MGVHQVYNLSAGDRFGRLTVIGKTGRDKAGHQLFSCWCDCGNITSCISSALRNGSATQCNACAIIARGKSKAIPIVGQTFGTWEVVSECGKNQRGAVLFKCRCVNCGVEAKKTSGSIRRSTEEWCLNCKPGIEYLIEGAAAIGVLPNGMRFYFDANRLDEVSAICWTPDNKGYLRSKKHGSLHHFLLGVGSDVIVDHINRNKQDYRFENLRLVTPTQNATNRSLQRNNTTGYRGVCWQSCCGKYRAEITSGGRYLQLGYYKDPELAAAAYNIAAAILCGAEYCGYVNPVPAPPPEFARKITNRCHSFLQEAA
jgi:hypothetical protein